MIVPSLARTCGASLVALAAPCIAASFDCAKAHTVIEHAICASAKLSALDSGMASSYRRALRALSPEGARTLTASQRAWLDFVGRACTVHDAADASALRNQDVCLSNEIGERIAQLDQAGVRVGPYVLNRIDRFEIVVDGPDDQNGSYPGLAVHRLSYPQIDAAGSRSAIAWNAAQVTTFPQLDDGEDFKIDYRIGCAGPGALSIEWDTYDYGHGTPHGTGSAEVRNTVLPTLEEMTSDDLFVSDAPWEDTLPSLFWSAYLHGDRVIKDTSKVEPAIREAAVTEAKWLLTPQGLRISFDSYEAGCYACNPGPLTVPWSSLKSMLASPDLAVCKAAAVARP